MTDLLTDVRMSDECIIKAKIIGDDPKNPLMIANHGAPGISTHKETEAWCGFFSEWYRVLVFDMRGSGESDQKGPYTHKRWMEDVDELRQWAGAETFVMVGASHGGFITLAYAVNYPQRVKAIIVGDSAAQIAHWGTANMVAQALTDPRVKPDPAQFVRLATGTCINEADYMQAFTSIAPLYAAPDEVKDKAEVDVGKFLVEATKFIFETNSAAMGDCVSRYDVRDRLHELQIPAFVFCGRHDWITPPVLSEELAKGIQNSKLVIYENSGHLPALEEKSLFSGNVQAWLKENDL